MIPHNRVCLRPEDGFLLSLVAQSGQISQGPQVKSLETALAERFRPGGAAACVSSGTAAIRLAVNVLDIRDLTIPTYACIALYHAVADSALDAQFGHVGLVDCDPISLNAEADLVVHTYGNPSRHADIKIEDFTHGVGGMIEGRPLGSLGVVSVLSLGATKPLGCGVGGAVLGPPDLIAEVKDLRDYDGKREYRPRFNYEMSEFVAALGTNRLLRLDSEVAERRERASRYDAICREKGIPVCGTPDSTWYRFVIRVADPGSAIAHFAEQGVAVINPLEDWELLHRQLGLDRAGFPNAEAAAVSTVSLPNWIGMSREDEDAVLAALSSLEVPA